MTILTQEEALRLFEYRDGELFWKPKTMSRGRPSVLAGRKVGCLNGSGYVKMVHNKRKYYLHQLVFLMHHGYIPSSIDHIDGVGSNNRIENLRPASVSENMYNTKLKSTNTSGFKGVHFNKQHKKWQAKLWIQKKQIARMFETKELAVEFMELFREMAHGQFANHGHHKGASA
jgi:hypothetical protein